MPVLMAGKASDLQPCAAAESDRRPVSGTQQFSGLFSGVCAVNRADGVDDRAGGLDAEGGGDDGLACRAVSDRVASPRQRLRAGRAEDRAAHAAARFERRVCGIDNSVGLEGRDIALDNLDETWGAGGHRS